ncbi:MAG: flagellar hook-associated protein [Hyphococcus sp.]|nr:MAG: flagellar hook-associated protein [Marinicaulis sp.]
MSITSALSNANSGLSAASKRASVVSNNIANALTPGYARRELSVSENVTGGRGSGVGVDGISRAFNQALTNDRRVAESMMTRDQTIATTQAGFNSALGEPGDAFSLFNQYQQLETSLRSLAQTPESQPLQAQVLDAANALVSRFNQLSDQTQITRQNADAQIGQQVDFVNSTLKQIEKLNGEISSGKGGGRDVTALEDQRKTLIDQVSALVPVREVPRGNDRIDLITNEGVFLIAGKAREIQFTPANGVTPDMMLGGALSGLTVEGSDITPGGGGGFAIQQGGIAGLFEVRDQLAPAFQSQIDGLARDVIERFENIDPTLAPGAPGLFTDAGAALDPTNETGIAGRIALNADVDPNQGGAAWRLRDGLGAATEGPAGNASIIVTLLDALTNLKAPPASTGLNGQLSAAEAVANVTSSVGATRISAETRLASSSARTQALMDAETENMAVDTDAELQKLLQIEQAFAANARVIQTADDMIRRLLEI